MYFNRALSVLNFDCLLSVSNCNHVQQYVAMISIDQYAPNIKKLLADEPQIKKLLI